MGTYLLKDSYFATSKGLQGPSQFLILYASGVLNVLKAKLLGIVEQHQNYSLEVKTRKPENCQNLSACRENLKTEQTLQQENNGP